jgi:hypothetical protein
MLMRAFRKIVFCVTVLLFFLIAMIASMLALHVLIPAARGAGGHYRPNGGGMLGFILALVLSVSVADRGVSFLFRITGLSGGERWSIFKTQR